ncbi:hypothetical protein [Acidithrix sp. C25]|uniref:hypothetical protein n=1 Tax=Acidithrix sp. C25 TaxID=1671482 RepID=UPI00191BC946|nr:hypothetical protein [Acidithrix sp. C25]
MEVMRGLYNPVHPAQSLIMSWKPSDNKRKNKKQPVNLNNCDYGSQIKEFIPKQVQHRLDPDEVIELIETYQAGILVKELAKCYQIDRRTVSAILKRQGVNKRFRQTQSI